MSINNSKSTSVVKYLEYKQASYIGEIYKRGCPIDKAFIYMEKLCDHHTEKELRFMKASLDAVVEEKRFFAPKEVFYSSLSTGVFAFFFALFSASASLFIGLFGFLGGSYLDFFEGEKRKEEIKHIVEAFPSMFNGIYMFAIYVGIGVMIILLTIAVSMSVSTHRFNKAVTYKSIIDQCLEIKVSQNKEH
jgi:hypothetical protein